MNIINFPTNSRFFHDTESDTILSYEELKTIHSDAVKYGDTDILSFNDYILEVVNNGFMLCAREVLLTDLQGCSVLAKNNFIKSENKLYIDSWGSVYTKAGIYITGLESENDRPEFITALNKYYEGLNV